MTKAHWLRSEIEKLEGMKYSNPLGSLMENEYEEGKLDGYIQALTSIITRYKEELLELESK